MKFYSAILSVLLVSPFTWGASDALSKQTLTLKSADAAAVLDETVQHVKEIFENYQVATDSSMEILSPLQVGGSDDRPFIKVTIKKCVLVICETVNLDAEITVTPARGGCDRNYTMTANLERSSNNLTDYYDYFSVNGCLKKTSTGGTLELDAQAHRAQSRGGNGIVRDQILGVLKLQIKPIVKAINETLRAHGAR